MTDSKSSLPPKQFNVLVVGDSCIDEYVYGNCDRLNPEAPVPILNITRTEQKPGMAANVAENLKAFGCNVTLKTNEQQITKRRYIDERSGQHLLRVDSDVVVDPGKQIDIEGYDCIVISDYNKGYITPTLVKLLRRTFKGPIFADTKNPDLNAFEGCFVKINQLEYDKHETSCSELIVTLGKKGCMYNGEVYETRNVDVVDVCGAGDTFLAALSYAYLTTNDIVEAIYYANNASAITVQRHGVHSLTPEEISTL